MQVVSNRKAISTFIMIILILVAIIFGALISYLWVMANFYLEPENTVDLAITEAVFPVNHADYFNLTVMNPTHSASGTNITKIYLTVEDGKNLTEVKNTYPETLPIPLAKGTIKTIQCFTYWGAFAGKEITIHVLSVNGSGATKTVQTETVKLELHIIFDASISCKEFSASVINDRDSKINLTLTKILVNNEPLQNLTISLPRNIMPGTSASFRGFYNWINLANPVVNVTTAEGYWVAKKANATASVLLIVTDVSFDEEKPDEIYVTVENSALSKASVEIANITIGYDSEIDVINENKAYPQLPYKLGRNTTKTFTCYWSWKERRNKELTIIAYTKQGYISTSLQKPVKTPPPAIIKITDLSFTLAHKEFFLVNVTNHGSSIQNVTVKNATVVVEGTVIKINENEILPSFFELGIGETQQFNCTFNWTRYEGKNVTITIYTNEGFRASRSFTLPILILDVKFDSDISKRYFSITINNKALSTINVTGINFNGTWINATLTYPSLPTTLENGKILVIICPLEWQPLIGNNVTIVVETANGFDVTITVTVRDM